MKVLKEVKWAVKFLSLVISERESCFGVSYVGTGRTGCEKVISKLIGQGASTPPDKKEWIHFQLFLFF